MTDEDERSEQVDEFTIEDQLKMLNITYMRCYDVLGALLNHFDPELWARLDELHESGRLFNDPPTLVADPWDHRG